MGCAILLSHFVARAAKDILCNLVPHIFSGICNCEIYCQMPPPHYLAEWRHLQPKLLENHCQDRNQLFVKIGVQRLTILVINFDQLKLSADRKVRELFKHRKKAQYSLHSTSPDSPVHVAISRTMWTYLTKWHFFPPPSRRKLKFQIIRVINSPIRAGCHPIKQWAGYYLSEFPSIPRSSAPTCTFSD